jgi:protein TonB
MIEEAIERVRNRVLAQQKESELKSRGGSEYAAYIQGVKNAIVRVWRYPEAALKNRQEGRVEVEFSILEDGSLENVRILHSSEYASMDQEALRAVKAAAPFHRIPEKLALKRMSVEFTFNYILEKTP